MQKFTQGQWAAQYDDNGFYFVVADKRPSPYIVATGGEGDVDEANANLISASPDLLEALVEAKLFVEQTIIETGFMVKVKKELLSKIDAAISKAIK